MLKEKFGKSPDSRKTVVYFGGFRLPDKNAAAHRVVSNAKILVSLGYNVILVGQGDTIKFQEIDCTIKGITMYLQPYPSTNLEWVDYLIGTKLIKKMCVSYNTSHLILYNYPSFAQIRLLFFLKRHKIKLIGDITEWYMQGTGNLAMKIVKSIDTYIRMSLLNYFNSGNIVISKFLKKKYENTTNLLLPPLVDLSESKWTPICIKKENNYPVEFIYAGQLGDVKDRLDIIIKILYKIKKKNSSINFLINIVGITEEEYIKKIDSKRHDFMVLHGRVTHQEAIKLIKKSDFSIFFRDINRVNTAGFPTKFVESITCGTPVITNQTSDIDDYLIPYKNGFIIEPNEQMIRQKLEEVMLMGRSEIDAMKKYCKLNNPFDINNYSKDFEKFMNSL